MKKLLSAVVILNCSVLFAQYNGSGSVTQGLATTTAQNLYSCIGGRTPALGTITASDNTIWEVPATVNYSDNAFPFASDLYNSCNGSTFSTSTAALNALDGSDIVTIDPTGEVITAYIFADNYFEMYINGIPVGKDNVPYTQFNSNIVRFRVNRPFTISMLLVDWEENLGIGTENNNGSLQHIGDGGMVAVFKDENDNTVAITGPNWKAQTFYTSPIKDLSCPTENGTYRLSSNCNIADSQDGSNYYGLHWNKPNGWMNELFDDSSWPNATIYTNVAIGVDNKPAYMNFISIFDDQNQDAQFIWSTNVNLDNEVIVRYTVDLSTGLIENQKEVIPFKIQPNPAYDYLELDIDLKIESEVYVSITDSKGGLVYEKTSYTQPIDISGLQKGIYILQAELNGQESFQRFLVE